jgi:ribosomal protein S12 methylthiotransferase
MASRWAPRCQREPRNDSPAAGCAVRPGGAGKVRCPIGTSEPRLALRRWVSYRVRLVKKNVTENRPVRVGLVSLGCAKNLVDGEIMLGTLLEHGLEITNDPVQADVLIVNTCSFIDTAQEESVNTILESAALREARHRGQGLIVAGCLTQRYPEELPKLMPEVDAFIGVDQVAQIHLVVQNALQRRAQRLQATLDPSVPANGTPTAPQAQRPVPPMVEVHRRPRYIPDYATPRFGLTPRHFTYLKIAEGCNHPCSFCIIPRMRGSHRSRPQADVVQDARQRLADGVRELNLISQDSTYYGLDLRPQRAGSIAAPARFQAATGALPVSTPTLSTLLRELNALPGDFWIRLLYTHPAHWTEELIRTMADCPKVARYVDMPLQHIDDVMLERMRRETSRGYIEDLIGRIRARIPGISLRTTFIVGFPGETDARFQALLDFIRHARFERLGVFTYSREPDTRAGRMTGQIPDRVKRQRRDLAMTTQMEVARQSSASSVGRTMKVLVEGKATPTQLPHAVIESWEHGLLRAGAGGTAPARPRGRWMVARGEADAPDIDGRVYVRGALPAGEFAQVRICGHTVYDLMAEPV